MADCDRCGNEGADVTLILARDLDEPGTKMALCDDCGASATFMIGDWLGDGSEYDEKWRDLQDRADFSTTVKCAMCGHAVEVTQPADHSEYAPAGTCDNCGAINALVIEPDGGVQIIGAPLTKPAQ